MSSIIEQFANMGSGLLLSILITQPLAFAYLGYYPSVLENLQIAIVFVTFSIVRGFIWRRLFNKGLQSRLGSMIEQVLSTLSGIILSLIIIQPWLLPYFNIHTDMFENLQMAMFFTVISILRGYVWRRYFNNKIRKLYVRNKNKRSDFKNK